MKQLITLIIIWIMTAAVSAFGETDKLIIVLHPQVVVGNEQVCLSQVATLTGCSELVNQASGIMLGTFSATGQVLTADRNTILSRLASLGIPSGKVELSGSQAVQIRRNEISIEPGQIVEAAKACLEKQLEGHKISSIKMVGTASRIVLKDPNAVPSLSAVASRYQTPGTRKITVSILQNGVAVAQREVAFAVQYQVRRAVALRDLPPQTVIGADDIRIETIESNEQESGDWKDPTGLMVRRRITKGARINPDWLGPAAAAAETLIRRNQQVLVQLNTGAMYLSAPGQAMDEGRVGQLIRVKRGQRPDERIIYCTVQPDGTVRPQI